MTFKENFKRKYALRDTGFKNLIDSTIICVLHNFSLMLPITVLFLFVCDMLGNNQYDYDLAPWIYITGCIISILIIWITYRLQYDITYTRTYRESGQVRTAIAEKLRKSPLSYFTKKDPADLTMRIMGDCTMQENALTHWLPTLYGAIISTAIMAVMIMIYSPIMGIAALWPIPVSFAIIMLSKKIQTKWISTKVQKIVSVNEGVQEFIENIKDLKGNNANGRYLEKLNGRIKAVEGSEIAAEFGGAVFFTFAQLVLKFGIVTTALAGGYLLVDGTIDVIVFIMFLIIISRVYDPLSMALQFLMAGMTVQVSTARIQEVWDQPEQTGSVEFNPDGYDIVFDNVRFSYGEGKEVLKGLSFTAKQGEITALVGPSGEGKTTASKLAARFWDIDSGKITVGGVDVGTVDPETLLSCYSIVFQDVVLFNASVKDNIRVGRKGATDEEVLAMAKAAQCDEFVEKLPEGYDTVIGENGAKLSGGERQRISIARALLKDSPIVLMDEATASLDTECETQVQGAISRLIEGKTVIIVAHRLRTIEGADKIVVLTDGKVLEEGSGPELIEKGGAFAHMKRLQSESETWSL